MDVFQLVILSVLWFTLIFYVIKFYKKLTPEEKAELKQKPIQTVLEGFSPLGVTIFLQESLVKSRYLNTLELYSFSLAGFQAVLGCGILV